MTTRVFDEPIDFADIGNNNRSSNSNNNNNNNALANLKASRERQQRQPPNSYNNEPRLQRSQSYGYTSFEELEANCKSDSDRQTLLKATPFFHVCFGLI